MTDVKTVGSLAVRVAADIAVLEGLDPGALLRGTGIPLEDIRNPFRRFPWNSYVEVLDRLQAGVGGEDALYVAAQKMPKTLPEFSAIARAFVTPMALARFIFGVVDPVVWPMIEFELGELGSDRVQLRSTLARGFRGSRPFFVGSAGACLALPGYLGLPAATQEKVEMTDRVLVTRLHLPSARTLLSRARGARRQLERVLPFVTGEDREAREEAIEARRARETARRLERAQVQWRLTARQVDVLRELVAGRDNQQIAAALGCAPKTVEGHVSALLERSEASSRLAVVASFWADLG